GRFRLTRHGPSGRGARTGPVGGVGGPTRPRPSRRGDGSSPRRPAARTGGATSATTPNARPARPDSGAPIMAEDPFRIEHDLLGDEPVPQYAYFGIHTLRAVHNFPI